MKTFGWREGCALASVLILTGILYLRSGLSDAYFAADDFQWLSAGHSLGEFHNVPFPSGGGFYRPLVVIWFGGLVSLCGSDTFCYHLANLAVHLLNIALVFSIVLGLSANLRIAFLCTLLFALEPAYTQAVVWVSSITELLLALFFLGSLQAQILSWRAATTAIRTGYDLLAVASFALSLLAHEAAITMPVVAWFMWRHFGPTDLTRRRGLFAGLTACAVAFAMITIAANYRNPLFTQSSYRLGTHVIQHLLDYLVGLYVGPGSWLAYTGCVIGIGILLALNPVARFYALWLMITFVPYLGFTSGNVSRYSYLPAVGFAAAVAAAVVAGCDWLTTRFRFRRAVAQGLFLLLTAFVAIRFGRFCSESVRGHIRWTGEWRAYATTLAREVRARENGVLHVAAPQNRVVDAMYIEPMLRWVYQNYGLTVVVD